MPTDRQSDFSSEAVENSMKDAGMLKQPPSSSGVTRAMTFGEKLVGLTLNPSNDSKVDKAKRLFAEIADLVKEEVSNRDKTQLEDILYPHTIGEILNAQMNVVKLLTLKY